MTPLPPPVSIIVKMSTGADQAAGAITVLKASDAMSTFTVMVIGFLLEMLLALDEVAIFFFFLSLALDQVANSIFIDH
jgi:hypothetical protein